MNVSKSYRPKSGYEGCTVTFTDPLTDRTVDISEWPHTTQSSTEMAHLDGHPWLTDQPERKSKKEAS